MNADEKVRQLREFIDKNGLRNSEDMFHQTVVGHDPTIIQPLLLMRPYNDDDDYLDEMWTVLHAVEGFPDDIYVQELVATLPELCDNAPDFLRVLVGRVINSETCAPIFIDGVGALPAPAKKWLQTIFTGFLSSPKLSESTRKNCEAVLAKVRG